MKTTLTRCSLLVASLSLSSPAALWAHQGHAGDHGWLAGGMQPLLSVDHFLAGLFVAVVVSLGLTRLALRRDGLKAQAKR